MVILGGMGNTAGVAFAAVLLTVLLEYLRFVAGYAFLPDGVREIAKNRMIIYLARAHRAHAAASAGVVRRHPRVRRRRVAQAAEGRLTYCTMAALLDLQRCTVRFGGLTAVSELDLQIGAHDLVGLIGPNGAGKTTVFNIITGVYQPTTGSITFDGQIHRRVAPAPDRRARHRAHVPEHPALSRR